MCNEANSVLLFIQFIVPSEARWTANGQRYITDGISSRLPYGHVPGWILRVWTTGHSWTISVSNTINSDIFEDIASGIIDNCQIIIWIFSEKLGTHMVYTSECRTFILENTRTLQMSQYLISLNLSNWTRFNIVLLFVLCTDIALSSFDTTYCLLVPRKHFWGYWISVCMILCNLWLSRFVIIFPNSLLNKSRQCIFYVIPRTNNHTRPPDYVPASRTFPGEGISCLCPRPFDQYSPWPR